MKKNFMEEAIAQAKLAFEKDEVPVGAVIVKNGKIIGQLKDVAYQATTTDFWGSMKTVGGPSTYVLGGAFNCGKAQPGQIAAVSHGCPAAVFDKVNVLNTVAEASK